MLLDAHQREKATQDFSCSYSVEASAGTGKTTLLATRYANLLEESGGQVASIVAITFTEKAAHELKERIEAILMERNPQHAALPLLKNAYISTIHAFCMRILKEKSIEAGVDPEFKMIDPLQAYSFLKQSFMEWLEVLPEKNWQSLLRAISMGISLEKIKTLAFDLYRYRDMLDKLNLDFVDEPKVTPEIFKTISGNIAELWSKAEVSCTDVGDAGYLQIAQLASLTRQCESLLSEGSLEDWERFFIHRYKIVSPKGAQKNWQPAADLIHQKSVLTEIAEEVDALKSALRRHSFYALLQELKHFVAFVEALKLEKSFVDFDDLLFKTKNVLADEPEVLEALRHKFDFFLIDEYQDTDPLQAEIIWRLCSEGHEKSWMTNALVPSKLFLVGDPKQSIYRFRKASIEIYDETTREVVRQGGKLVIEQNFRSSEPVTSVINQMFQSVFADAYSPILPLSTHLFSSDPALIILKVTDAPLKLSADDQRKIEAESIAAYIKATLLKNEPIVFDKTRQILRAPKAGDFAILFPTTTGMDYYEESLRHHDLPFAVEGGSAFFHRLEIHGTLMVLKAILSPAEPISVVAALKSVIFGLSDQQIFELGKLNKTFDYREDVLSLEDPVIAEGLKILKTLHLLNTQRPSVILSKLYELCWTLPIAMFRFHGEQACANLLKLVSMARHLESENIQTLRSFLDWAHETSEQKSSQTEAFLSEKDGEHINLMTIHRSKGLEFPIVILANASGQSKSHGEQILCDRKEGWIEAGIGAEGERFSTLHYEEKLVAEKKSHEDEQKRLLYVALTRAKDKIVLPKFHLADKKPSLLWSFLEKGLMDMKPAPQEISSSIIESITSQKKPDAREDTSEIEALKKVYAQLTLEESLISETPSPEDIVISHGQKIGTLFHQVIEKIDFNAKNHDVFLKHLCSEKALTFLESSIDALFLKFYKMDIYRRLCAAKNIYREVPWSYTQDGRIYEGTIDCIFEDEAGWHIIDYKTDQSFDPRSEIYQSYVQQLSFYAHAFEHIFNLKPTSSILGFVSTRDEIIQLQP